MVSCARYFHFHTANRINSIGNSSSANFVPYLLRVLLAFLIVDCTSSTHLHQLCQHTGRNFIWSECANVKPCRRLKTSNLWSAQTSVTQICATSLSPFEATYHTNIASATAQRLFYSFFIVLSVTGNKNTRLLIDNNLAQIGIKQLRD